MAQDFVNVLDFVNNCFGRFVFGSLEFNEVFNDIWLRYNNEEGGICFFDRLAFYYLYVEKCFDMDFVEIIVGGNGWLYMLNLCGIIFYDFVDIRIINYEYGVYVGINKIMDDGRWWINVIFWVDKNENFDYVFFLVVFVVWKFCFNYYFRVSFFLGVWNLILID